MRNLRKEKPVFSISLCPQILHGRQESQTRWKHLKDQIQLTAVRNNTTLMLVSRPTFMIQKQFDLTFLSNKENFRFSHSA